MNQGVPLVESTPRSPVAKKLVEIVDRFANVAAERSAA
jgi:Flp pilus assembly CpaE family ATPase